MIFILLILLSIIFLLLGFIHFYWVIGGKWGLEKALPTKEDGNMLLKPKTIDTLFVGVILCILACFYILQLNLFSYKLPKWTNYFLWIIPTLFLLRAIGEFNYVGFFKRIKTTTFAKWDSKLFSPLCLFISIIGFLIANY